MMTWLRFLFRIPAPKISRERALHIAEEFFHQTSISFHNPQVFEEWRSWLVVAHGDEKPTSWVRIDHQQGIIIDSGDPLR